MTWFEIKSDSEKVAKRERLKISNVAPDESLLVTFAVFEKLKELGN